MRDLITDPLVVARFWSKIQVGGKRQCWPWLGATDSDGYGQMRVSNPRRLISTHRTALQLFLGEELGAGQMALHHCDNPPCCNPLHLYSGDKAQNMRDAFDRGLIIPRSQMGAANGNARLSVDDVIEIKRRIEAGDTNRKIAGEFDVGHAQVSNIRLGKSWSSVTVP